MDASMNQNDNKDECLSASSQPVRFTVTPVSNKRPLSDIRRQNSIGDLRDIGHKPAAKAPTPM